MTEEELQSELQRLSDRVSFLESHAATPTDEAPRVVKAFGAVIGSVVVMAAVWLLLLVVFIATRWVVVR